MKISSNNLQSILEANENKNVKNSVKILSDKNVEKKKLPTEDSIKAKTIKNLIETLFKDLGSNVKSKQSVSQILQDSNIDKSMKSTPSELKSLVDLVKNDKTLVKFAPTLEKLLLDIKDLNTSNLKEQVSKSGVFLESKLNAKTVQNMPLPLKEALQSLRQFIVQNFPKIDLHVSKIDTLLSSPKADSVFIQNLENLVKDLKSIPNKEISPIVRKLENILTKKIPISSTNVKEIILDLKQILQEISKGSSLHVENIDKILNSPKADKVFIEDIKNLLRSLKDSKSVNKAVVEIVAKVEKNIKQGQLIESKIRNKVPLDLKEVNKIANDIKMTLYDLKQLTQKSSEVKAPILMDISKEVIKIVDQNLNIQNFFPKNLPKATISEKLGQLVNLLKSKLSLSDTKSNLHVEVAKLTNKLELAIKSAISNKTIVPNQNLHVETLPKIEIVNDIKATLLNMKKELSQASTPHAKEALLKVDKLLTHVDFYQLNSFATNANSLYLPFLWEGLQEGQISLKKLKDNKFFCEINLKLKEYGNIDLMIMLFDDININMSIFADKQEFLDLVNDNLTSLKQGINKLGLIPSNIHLYDATKDEKLKNDTRVFVNSSQLGMGINLKV